MAPIGTLYVVIMDGPAPPFSDVHICALAHISNICSYMCAYLLFAHFPAPAWQSPIVMRYHTRSSSNLFNFHSERETVETVSKYLCSAYYRVSPPPAVFFNIYWTEIYFCTTINFNCSQSPEVRILSGGVQIQS